MKAEIKINIDELVSEITQKVTNAIIPTLKKGTDMGDTVFTVETLAKYLQVSKQWVYARVHLKEIPHIKMGKFPRFKKREIDIWLESFKIPAIQPLSGPLKIIKKSSSSMEV
jgi:excisionase family DNA binding protein